MFVLVLKGWTPEQLTDFLSEDVKKCRPSCIGDDYEWHLLLFKTILDLNLPVEDVGVEDDVIPCENTSVQPVSTPDILPEFGSVSLNEELSEGAVAAVTCVPECAAVVDEKGSDKDMAAAGALPSLQSTCRDENEPENSATVSGK